MIRFTFSVPARIKRISVPIRNLVAHIRGSIKEKIVVSSVGDATLAKPVTTPHSRLRITSKSIKASKTTYLSASFTAILRSVAVMSIGKTIKARKRITAVLQSSFPRLAKVDWRVLDDFDEYLLSVFDQTILQDMDYLSLEEAQNG